MPMWALSAKGWGLSKTFNYQKLMIIKPLVTDSISFIFDRCRHSLATPVKYECDSTHLTETFVAKPNMSLAAKLTNTASVTPAPELISVDNIQISRGRGPLGFTKSDYTGGRLNLLVLSFIFGNHENIFVSYSLKWHRFIIFKNYRTPAWSFEANATWYTVLIISFCFVWKSKYTFFLVHIGYYFHFCHNWK